MKTIMKLKNTNIGEHQKNGHSHAGHMWMMVIFCGIPIIGFLVIGLLDISTPSLEPLFLLVCSIGMIGMMVMMQRDSDRNEKQHSRHLSEKEGL